MAPFASDVEHQCRLDVAAVRSVDGRTVHRVHVHPGLQEARDDCDAPEVASKLGEV